MVFRAEWVSLPKSSNSVCQTPAFTPPVLLSLILIPPTLLRSMSYITSSGHGDSLSIDWAFNDGLLCCYPARRHWSGEVGAWSVKRCRNTSNNTCSFQNFFLFFFFCVLFFWVFCRVVLLLINTENNNQSTINNNKRKQRVVLSGLNFQSFFLKITCVVDFPSWFPWKYI